MTDVTKNEPSVASVALKYGLIGGLVMVVYTAIIMILGMGTNKLLLSLSYIIMIAVLVFAMQNYKKENHGYMSYGQGLGVGTLASVIMGILGGIFMYVYTSFIDPNYLQGIMDQQVADLEARGMSDEQIDAAIAMTEKFSGPGMQLVSSVIGYLFIGFILSLIISAIIKNRRPEFE